MQGKHRSSISRRRLLKVMTALGFTGLTQRLSRNQVLSASEIPNVPAASRDDLDHHVYLPFVSSPAAHGPSKLGVHTVKPNNAIGFVQDMHDAGARVAIVKAVDDFGYIRFIKEASPQTVTIGRWTVKYWVAPVGDPAEKARNVMDQHMDRWKYEKDVMDYWEVLNENDPPTVEGHVWLAHFYMAAMDIADANGYKLAIFSYSVGVPKWHEWEAIVETGVFAQAKENGHILSLHEYNYPTMDHRWGEPLEDQPSYPDRGCLSGRYRHLYRDFLIPRDEVIPLAICEGGLDPVLWEPGMPTTWRHRLVEEMIWYDTRLREDDYVIGVATFTIGGAYGWERYDYEQYLPDFRDYIVSLKDA